MPRSPSPSPPGPTVQGWIALLLAISLTGMAGAVIWTGLVQGTSPLVSASDAPLGASAPAPIANVTFPEQVAIVTHTPQPTAIPTPTYSVLPTPRPLICGSWVQVGDVCTMPKAPRPTPTPLATCPVEPEEDCIWQGGRSDVPFVPPVTATPSVTPSMRQ